MAEIETHVHYRPGGAVFNATCSCADPSSWPVGATASAAPEPTAAADTLRSSEQELDVARNANAPHFVRIWLGSLIARGRVLAATSRRRAIAGGRVARRGVAGAASVTWAFVQTVAEIVFTVLTALGNGAQVAGVAVGSWAAWEVDPIAGKIVLAVGLLFLGGAIARVAKEVRNGHR